MSPELIDNIAFVVLAVLIIIFIAAAGDDEQ